MIRTKTLLLTVPLFAIVPLFKTDLGAHYVRTLAVSCVQNVYATVDTVKNLPEIPASTTQSIPAYIALCQEWIRHEAYHQSDPPDTYQVVEDEEVCMDWSAPHMGLMDMFSAMMLSQHVKRVKYRHNCDRTKEYDEIKQGFTSTTIQQVMNTPAIKSATSVISTEDLKMQCKRCLLTFDPQLESVRVRAKGYHHPFAFPEDHNKVRNLDPSQFPYVSYNFPGVTPIGSSTVPVRQRLWLSAIEWNQVTAKPPKEEREGVVYWIDPTSVGLAYADVLAEIPNAASYTSISILSGPLCATGVMPTGQLCHDYGEGLRDYLVSQLPAMAGKGHGGEHGVTFKIIATTAGAFSRMILSKMLVCPPRTPTCLFPSMAKRINKNEALVLEDPAYMKAVDFLAVVGHHGTVTAKILDASKIPPTYTSDPERRLEAEQFNAINAITDDEGYPDGVTRAHVPADSEINKLTPQQILNDLTFSIDRFKANPHWYKDRREVIPTMEQVQNALYKGETLSSNQINDWNYPQFGNGGNNYRHGELATNADSDRMSPRPGIEYWKEADTKRHESLLRIQHDWETAFYGHIMDNRKSPDPSTVFEIECPIGAQANGDEVKYVGGAAITTTSNKIILADYNGIRIQDKTTRVQIDTGLENVPLGTVYREDFGYKIKDSASDKHSQENNSKRRVQDTARKVVEITKEQLDDDMPFKADVQKICEKYSNRLMKAVAEFKQANVAKTT